MIPVLQAYIPDVQVATLAEGVYQDEWSVGECFLQDYWKLQGGSGLRLGPWLEVGESECHDEPWRHAAEVRRREISLVMPCPPSLMCPEQTRITITYQVGLKKDSLLITSSVVSHDVPYGDYFLVQEQLFLTPEADGVSVTKKFGAEFVKRTWVQSMIESSIRKGQQASCDNLLSSLENYKQQLTPGSSQDLGSSRSSSDSDKGAEEHEEGFCPDELPLPMQERVTLQGTEWGLRKSSSSLSEDESPHRSSSDLHLSSDEGDSADTIYVWELQRRVTLFSDNWRAPFLPHDSSKQSRWLDANYKKHPCITKSRHFCAQSDTPPLDAAPGMRVKSLQVVEREGDSEGWQYAADFYRSKSAWSSSGTLCHCRRRLWQCNLSKVVPAEPRKLVIDIWELQRRTTIFQRDWRAPFLPHDRQKRHRWVDLSYEAHPWVSRSRSICSTSDRPPMKAPQGWLPEGWVVVEPPGQCDAGRWQYAVDFYESGSRWGGSSKGRHCRRRLWRCMYTEVIDDAASDSTEAPSASSIDERSSKLSL